MVIIIISCIIFIDYNITTVSDATGKCIEKFTIYKHVCKPVFPSHFAPRQSGNRRYHSSETLNVLVDDIILEAMDQKSVTALILLDLSKAFDSVHHLTLLNKLRHIGASPEVVKWFESYLTGRSQFVRIGTSVSSSLDITHGVPQGAILSPLLFSIYVNELPLAPRHSSLKSYVDDSKMFLSFRVKAATDIKEYIQEDLSRVANCCSEPLSTYLINPEKTKYLLIGARQQLQNLPTDMCLNLLGETIRPVPSAKDLGLIRDINGSIAFLFSVKICLAVKRNANNKFKCGRMGHGDEVLRFYKNCAI